MNPWVAAAAVVLVLAILKLARPKTVVVQQRGVGGAVENVARDLDDLRSEIGLPPGEIPRVHYYQIDPRARPISKEKRLLSEERLNRARRKPAPLQFRYQTTAAARAAATVLLPPATPINDVEAGRLAPLVAINIVRYQGYHSPELVSDFQEYAGLRNADGVPTGLYDGRTMGALRAFGVGDPPPAMYPPYNEVVYAPITV